MATDDILKLLKSSNADRKKLSRLMTVTNEFLEYLIEHAKNNNIPLPKNVNFYLSQIQADGECYNGSDSGDSTKPPQNQQNPVMPVVHKVDLALEIMEFNN